MGTVTLSQGDTAFLYKFNVIYVYIGFFGYICFGMKNIVYVLMLNLFLGANLWSSELDITKASDSNSEATKQLFRMAEDIGCTVEKYDNDSFKLNQGGLVLLVSVMAMESNLDRLDVHVFFRGNKLNIKSEKFAFLVNRINSKYSACTVTYDETDGSFIIRWAMPFDNKLSAKVFRQWIDSVVSGTKYVLDKEPELFK